LKASQGACFRIESRTIISSFDRHKACASRSVVISSGKDGIVGIAMTERGIVAAHAVFGFELADDGFDGGPAQFALDPRCDASPLPVMKPLN
jgi:hypothetical protein